jgi:tetratricopeptide (TPR) repeat protein
VARVLNFYAARLTEPDRYLVAAVALFAHPITPHAVLTVANHDTFADHLAGWTSMDIEAAASDRLAGLLSWHADGTLSAHPLVRDVFRPLALGVAQVAAAVTLSDIPEGTITTREQGPALVEAIELLLDADQWQAANDMYRNRTDDGYAWMKLPAARLGQRCATAFVATPTRRQTCSDRLTERRMSLYLNEVGLFAMNSGDLITARAYLDMCLQQDRDSGDWGDASTSLNNLTEALGHLGDIHSAREAAEEALVHAAEGGSHDNSNAFMGWVSMLAGDTQAAERHFISADLIEHAYDESIHLCSIRGTQWGEFLVRTNRHQIARNLTDQNRKVCARSGWNADVARCDRLLGVLDLAAGDAAAAREHLTAAATTFRDGDYLVDLAATLPILADSARISGDIEVAERHVGEALDIAMARGLRLSHAHALVVRSRIQADRAANHGVGHIPAGRDAADAALRIATRHRLAWHELDALDAHARLDQVEGVDHGWARQAKALRARLIPPDLDPDPLATVKRQVAEEKAREDDEG